MNRTHKAGRTECFHVEGTGRIYQVEPIQNTKNSLGETQSYRFFQLECAGNPEPGGSKMPIQPIRIRCKAWDRDGINNATILQGIKDRSHIRITGFLDPWFQLWGPNGTPEGFMMTVPNGGQMDQHGRVIGHARPWETLNIRHGATLIETAQLTIITVEVLDSHVVIPITPQKLATQTITLELKQYSEESLNAILAGEKTPAEDSELGRQAPDTKDESPQPTPTESTPKQHLSSSYDTSKDFLKVTSIIRLTNKSETLVEAQGQDKKLSRTFMGVANQNYYKNETLIEQQPLRLLCRLKDGNTMKVDDWEEGTPVEAGGYLKALNYIWGPTKEKEGIRKVIPGPGEENGQSRPWELIYTPAWNRNCCVIQTFQVVIHEIYRADTEAKWDNRKTSEEVLKHNDSPEWQAKRAELLKRDGMLCVCGGKATEVHHKTYRDPRQEPLSAFVALCGCCYERVYSREKKRWQGSKNPMNCKEYKVYLKSPNWQRKRKEILKRDDNRCICGGLATLVHHKTYKNVGQEQLSDLVALCESCHAGYHPSGRRHFRQ